MFFLLRMAFWIGLVLVLLPSGKTQEQDHGPQVGTSEAVTAATAAVSDLSQFCVRQPTACDIGGQAAAVIGQRAQAGARKVYEFISEKTEKSDKAEATPELKPEAKPDLKPEPKVEAKTTGKAEAKPDKKPARAARKNPDHTGSIGSTELIESDGSVAFDNTPVHGSTTPDWPIAGVDTVAPLLP